METMLRSVFEAEAKAASASPAKVVYTVAVPITKVYSSDTSVTFKRVASITFILVNCVAPKLGSQSWDSLGDTLAGMIRDRMS